MSSITQLLQNPLPTTNGENAENEFDIQSEFEMQTATCNVLAQNIGILTQSLQEKFTETSLLRRQIEELSATENVPALLHEVADLQAENSALKTQNADLQAENSALKEKTEAQEELHKGLMAEIQELNQAKGLDMERFNYENTVLRQKLAETTAAYLSLRAERRLSKAGPQDKWALGVLRDAQSGNAALRVATQQLQIEQRDAEIERLKQQLAVLQAKST